METSVENDLRIWSKVVVGDCWEWLGAISTSGYGLLRREGKSRQVHRHVYEGLVGPIPEGLQLDHLCRNRKCCNPDHLEPVTQQENILRGQGLASVNARKTECVNGHAFTENNTWPNKRGKGRKCRSCSNAAVRKHKARKKGLLV